MAALKEYQDIRKQYYENQTFENNQWNLHEQVGAERTVTNQQ